ncbi:MAG: dihydrodipicolinate synthase family protein [Defluviitaleaceae bacterium]|nr:dihydrodipicolinate synthase family protein [Defluviitaleaceae bacterium]
MRKEALSLLQSGTVIPATPLALTADKKLDEKHQRLLMRYFLNAGAGGIASGVHSTQFEIHDPKVGLLAPVLEIVTDEVAIFEAATGKTIIKIAGACGPASQAVKEAELAKKLGYDAVLLSPGGLPDIDEAGHLTRARAVAEVMPVVGFSLQRAVGGPALTYKYWEAISEIENLVAIKTAPFDRYQTLDILRAVAWSGRSIAMYTGNDDTIVTDLLTEFSFPRNGRDYTISFAGGLLGHYSVWTKTHVDMFAKLRQARESGEISAELLTLAAKITDMNAAVFDPSNGFKGCISGIHEVLHRQGLMAGIWCLSDHEKLSPGQARELDRVCAMYPELTDDDFVQANIGAWS